MPARTFGTRIQRVCWPGWMTDLHTRFPGLAGFIIEPRPARRDLLSNPDARFRRPRSASRSPIPLRSHATPTSVRHLGSNSAVSMRPRSNAGRAPIRHLSAKHLDCLDPYNAWQWRRRAAMDVATQTRTRPPRWATSAASSKKLDANIERCHDRPAVVIETRCVIGHLS